jgi:hypothetical protein
VGGSPEAEPSKEGGGGKGKILIGRERKDKFGKLLMTKLLTPRHQVTLSQIPPSQKETQGVEDTPSLQARPRADSKLIVDPYGPNIVLHWPVKPTFLRFG